MIVRENPDPELLSPAWIRALRGGLSQEAWAEKLGVSKSMVSKWERGVDQPMGKGVLALLRRAGLVSGGANGAAQAVDSPMTAIERKLLETFRKLPEDRQLQLVIDLAGEATRRNQKGMA